MEETKTALLENEEVIENVVEEVVESGSKLSTIGAMSLGAGLVVASVVIAKNAPKVGRAIMNKIQERKAAKSEQDYITEELENDVIESNIDTEC